MHGERHHDSHAIVQKSKSVLVYLYGKVVTAKAASHHEFHAIQWVYTNKLWQQVSQHSTCPREVAFYIVNTQGGAGFLRFCTCCASEEQASQHQPQSSRQLACPAVTWHTWQLEEKLLSTASTTRTKQAFDGIARCGQRLDSPSNTVWPIPLSPVR